jgi:DNA-binding CsgD family transcriptional regulator
VATPPAAAGQPRTASGGFELAVLSAAVSVAGAAGIATRTTRPSTKSARSSPGVPDGLDAPAITGAELDAIRVALTACLDTAIRLFETLAAHLDHVPVADEMKAKLTIDVPSASVQAAADAASTMPVRQLTHRQMDVVRLLAEGCSNRAIAGSLSISERTVENHVFQILTRLDLESRAAVAAWAVRAGIA